jgi:hypothetical protein
MAKGKKKGKGKPQAKPGEPQPGAAEPTGEAPEEGSLEAEAQAEAEAAAHGGSPSDEAEAKGGPGEGRRRRRSEPRVDPNLPRPDGPNVSEKGGLVFVLVILGLIGGIIVLQFAVGG